MAWLTSGWDNPQFEAVWRTEREDPDLGRVSLQDEARLRLESWKVLRDDWAQLSASDYAALQLFQWLWDVHATLQREAERFELVIGDGVLAWDVENQTSSHPILIQRLQIEFDSTEPSFTVTEADRPPELYAGLLRALNVNPTVISNLMEAVREDKPHPLGAELTDRFLQRAAAEIHPQGEFLGSKSSPASRHFPQITRAPVLFLRSRALGYESAIQAIKEDLEAGGEIPDALSALVGLHPSIGMTAEVVDPFEQGDEAEDILLTKEANREQLEIARRLARYGAVRVQGPPGTGKTHTIANLIGHLLANGKTVLVTSHTTKALRVLREKVVEQLQPLCVSVLEGDAAGNAQLADAVNKIGSRLSATSEDQLRREAEVFRNRRKATLDGISAARAHLLAIVQGEYSAIVIDGTEISPIEAARRVFAGTETDSWIPERLERGTRLPLSTMEVRRLYQLNRLLPVGDIVEIEDSLVDIDLLPSPIDFEKAVRELQSVQAMASRHGEFWIEATRSRAELQASFEAMQSAFLGLEAKPHWYLQALEASSMGDEVGRQPWLRLLEALENCQTAIREARIARQTYAAILPAGMANAEAGQVLQRILEHLQAGKQFGLLTPLRWKRFIAASSVLGRRPATIEEFDALYRLTLRQTTWEAIVPRWQVLIEPHGEAIPGHETQDDEEHIATAIGSLRDALERRPRMIRQASTQARILGLDIERLLPPASFDLRAWWQEAANIVRSLLPEIMRAEIARLRTVEILAILTSLEEILSRQPGQAELDRVHGKLLLAVRSRNVEDYTEAYDRLRVLIDRRSLAGERETLLERLSRVANGWAEAIRLQVHPHDADEPPGDPVTAWQWKLLAQELDARAAEGAGDVIATIGRLKDQLREQTSELIDREAWAAQQSHITPQARMALAGYVALVRRIGRGTGRRAPGLRAEAREQMSVARDAVPVWIAPLSRVAEAFDARMPRFDVVIIDEASQSDVLGLISWYLGKQVIVVGDDQQVTPDAVGERIDDIDAMIDAFLRDIPSRRLYNGQASVYELAGIAFQGVVALREHFRCVPDIISFSNDLSYNGEILPLRDPSRAAVGPAVVPYRIEAGAVREGDVNEEEARAVASLLLACLDQSEYKDLTFGVMSLLGAQQAARIEQILRNVITPGEYEERRILCGIPPHFQGDERDVIFLTMVDSPPETPPLPRRGDQGERFKKRYNVAASRARDQLWVVHSLDKQRDLQVDDLRWRLLEWATDPAAVALRQAQATRQAQSPFEIDVINRLIGAGFRVEPQYPVGAYRIDIVVQGTSARLAVECDGEAFHSTTEQIRSDLDRQALLERMGWRFHRIRGSDFYRNPEAAFDRLNNELARLGIKPTSHATEQNSDERTSDLMDRVKTRAEAIRHEWEERGVPGAFANWSPQRRSRNRQRSSAASPGAPAWQSQRTAGATGTTSTSSPVEPEYDSANSGLTPIPGNVIVPSGPQMSLIGPSGPQDPSDELAELSSLDMVAAYFRRRGIRVDDGRPAGPMWIYGGEADLQPAMSVLIKRGLRFRFGRRRGRPARTPQPREGWYAYDS